MITNKHIEDFEANGVVCVRQAVSAEWVERVRGVVTRALESPSAHGKNVTPPDASGGFHSDGGLWRSDDDLRDYVFHSGVATLVSRLMRSSTVSLFSDHMFVMEPQTLDRTDWHHDLPYFPFSGWQISSAWLALDPVSPTSGGLRYVPGSHRWEKRFRDANWRESPLEVCPNYDNAEDGQLLSWDLEPGDLVVHHGLVVHGTGPNTTDLWRRAMDTVWTGDDARYDPRPLTTQMEGCELSAGDRVDCAVHPVVFDSRECSPRWPS